MSNYPNILCILSELSYCVPCISFTFPVSTYAIVYRHSWWYNVQSDHKPHITNKPPMMTSSNGNIFRVPGPLWASPVNALHEGQWRGAMMFSLICPWKKNSKQSRRWWFETPLCSLWRQCLNPLRPSDAYMHRWNGSSLVQIMACRLFGAKPLSEPMLGYCWLDP